MKIIAWNCNGALRKKYESLLDYNAYIHIIQECENPALSKDKKYMDWASNYLWIGDTKNKGVGVFVKHGIKLSKLDWSNAYKDHTVKHFLPCRINDTFNLLAVWTHQNSSPNFGYIGQFWKYLQINKENFKNIIIAGDFNSNVIWDEWDRWWNHSDVIRELGEINIESLYHKVKKEKQGKESQATFYHQRNLKKPYHIDYCFASKEHSNKIESYDIEPFEKRKHVSDHSPIIMIIKHK